MTSSLHPCRGRNRSSATRVRRRTDGRLSSFPQARAYARQPTTRMPAGGRWCGSRAEAAHQRCNQARQSCRKLRGCADRVSVAHVRGQENLEVRGGVSITGHREKYPDYLPPTTIPWQASSSPTESRYRRALLITYLVHHVKSLSIRSSSQPRLPQGLPRFTESS
jgi:hypothetical protein